MTSPSPSPLLPPLYTQPSVTDLISVLEALALAPPTWAPTTSHLDDQPRPYAQNGVSIPAYLTGIVASPLHWISPEKRERVWELASRRLSERAGRTGAVTCTVLDVVFCSMAEIRGGISYDAYDFWADDQKRFRPFRASSPSITRSPVQCFQ